MASAPPARPSDAEALAALLADADRNRSRAEHMGVDAYTRRGRGGGGRPNKLFLLSALAQNNAFNRVVSATADRLRRFAAADSAAPAGGAAGADSGAGAAGAAAGAGANASAAPVRARSRSPAARTRSPHHRRGG